MRPRVCQGSVAARPRLGRADALPKSTPRPPDERQDCPALPRCAAATPMPCRSSGAVSRLPRRLESAQTPRKLLELGGGLPGDTPGLRQRQGDSPLCPRGCDAPSDAVPSPSSPTCAPECARALWQHGQGLGVQTHCRRAPLGRQTSDRTALPSHAVPQRRRCRAGLPGQSAAFPAGSRVPRHLENSSNWVEGCQGTRRGCDRGRATLHCALAAVLPPPMQCRLPPHPHAPQSVPGLCGSTPKAWACRRTAEEHP